MLPSILFISFLRIAYTVRANIAPFLFQLIQLFQSSSHFETKKFLPLQATEQQSWSLFKTGLFIVKFDFFTYCILVLCLTRFRFLNNFLSWYQREQNLFDRCRWRFPQNSTSSLIHSGYHSRVHQETHIPNLKLKKIKYILQLNWMH